MADSFKKSDHLAYYGGATLRRISRDEWIAAGIENQDTVEFREGNRQIRVGEMSADAVRLLLERHADEFRIDSDKTPAPNGE